jgi:hypothetical protein
LTLVAPGSLQRAFLWLDRSVVRPTESEFDGQPPADPHFLTCHRLLHPFKESAQVHFVDAVFPSNSHVKPVLSLTFATLNILVPVADASSREICAAPLVSMIILPSHTTMVVAAASSLNRMQFIDKKERFASCFRPVCHCGDS